MAATAAKRLGFVEFPAGRVPGAVDTAGVTVIPGELSVTYSGSRK